MSTHDGNLGLGFGTAAIAVVFFGSSYVPAKKYYMGDGMFFQWCLCLGIWVVGVIVNLVQDSPPFEPLAMLGGAFWCTGNLFVIPIIQCVGMAMGLLLWGATNMLMGWSMGYWGLFGLNPAPATTFPLLNYVGVVVALCAMVSFAFVKTTVADGSDLKDLGEEDAPTERLLTTKYDANGTEHKLSEGSSGLNNKTAHDPEMPIYNTTISGNNLSLFLPPCPMFTDTFSAHQRTVFGYGAAASIGILYAVNFAPPQYLLDSERGSPQILDYVFSHFTGLFFASTFYFLMYCLFKKNRPWINPESALPGFLSGIMWAIAQTAWFIANNELSYTIAYPIVTTGPGVIGALWGVFVFKEISGKRNYVVLCGAIGLTLVGVALIATSRVG